jgi:hypothetical protein
MTLAEKDTSGDGKSFLEVWLLPVRFQKHMEGILEGGHPI